MQFPSKFQCERGPKGVFPSGRGIHLTASIYPIGPFPEQLAIRVDTLSAFLTVAFSQFQYAHRGQTPSEGNQPWFGIKG